MPVPNSLRDLLKKTGPLIAPSANKEKFRESENVDDAGKYFGNAVDLYVDGGSIRDRASKVIKLEKDGTLTVLRA
jgi:L-threonylcarbamoyladenylate synthase